MLQVLFELPLQHVLICIRDHALNPIIFLELYIDFTITQDTITDEYKDFKINLNAQELTEYVYNGKYNWNITIGTRNAITFDVSVTPWQDAIVPGEYPLS